MSKPMVDYVVCKLCGKNFKSLQRHLQSHNLTVSEYKEKYGGEIICESLRKVYSKHMTENRKKYPEIFKSGSIKGGKKTHREWKERDPKGYREHQLNASKMSSGKDKLIERWKNDRENSIKIAVKNLEKANEANKKWRQEDPEGYHESKRRAGVSGHKAIELKYPNLSEILSERAKNTHKKHPDLAKRLGKITQEKHPDIIHYALDWCKEHPEEYKRIRIQAAKKSRRTNRENKPYWFMDVPFDSNGERNCAKILNEKINFIPVDSKNCHVEVDGKFIDFYLEGQNLFIEYHPMDLRGLSDEEYEQERLNAMDNGGFSSDLAIIKNLDELDSLVTFLVE